MLSCCRASCPTAGATRFHIQRLKDKLGNRSNASSEIELHGAWARMVGEPGRGVPTIIEMVGHTRLDCVIGSAAGMRAGVVQRHPPRRPSPGLRQAADRPAADAQRAGRPVPGVRGDHRARDAPGARLRRGATPTRRRARTQPTRSCSSAWPPPSASTGCASAPPTTPTRRSSASAATATSRSRGCRVCIARRRWPRSGRARATS